MKRVYKKVDWEEFKDFVMLCPFPFYMKVINLHKVFCQYFSNGTSLKIAYTKPFPNRYYILKDSK